MLVVAVPSYYLAAAAIQDDALRAIVAPTSLLWMFFGVLAGVVFGVAGAWARLPAWRAVIGAALPGAVSWAEAAMLLLRGRGDDAGTALLLALLGVLAIVLSTRTLQQRLTALAVAAPVALLGFVAYRSVGMGGPL